MAPLGLPDAAHPLSSSRAGLVSQSQLLTRELLEGSVRLHAKPLAVFIEGLQPQLSRFFDDLYGHMQDMVVYVPATANLPRDKHS